MMIMMTLGMMTGMASAGIGTTKKLKVRTEEARERKLEEMKRNDFK